MLMNQLERSSYYLVCVQQCLCWECFLVPKAVMLYCKYKDCARLFNVMKNTPWRLGMVQSHGHCDLRMALLWGYSSLNEEFILFHVQANACQQLKKKNADYVGHHVQISYYCLINVLNVCSLLLNVCYQDRPQSLPCNEWQLLAMRKRFRWINSGVLPLSVYVVF